MPRLFTRFLACGSIKKVGYCCPAQTLADGTHGKLSSAGLLTVLWKQFRLQHWQHKSYWTMANKKYRFVQGSTKREHCTTMSSIFCKLWLNICQSQNFKGFPLLAASAGTTFYVRAAWKRLSLIYCYGCPTFPPVSRIARAVSLACARSNFAPRVLAVIIGEASWAHNRWAESEQLQANGSLYGQAFNRYAVFASFLWSLLEGFILLLRALYLMTLFTPAVMMTLFVYSFGRKYRKVWLQLLHWSLQKSGAAFIKWGQWAATRPDLFPRDVCNELAKLHSKAPAHEFSYTRKTVENAFQHKLHEIFEHFEEEPVASGSIAQVHKAALRCQYAGHKVKPMIVAVKVRHPGVTEVIRRDFVIIKWIAKISSFLPPLRWLRLDESVQQFSVFMLSQVDLAREAAHLSRFLYNFRQWKDVSFPQPLYPLVHPAVLVETYEQGESVAHYVEQPGGNNCINSALAHIGTHTLLKMLLVDNFIHADMHPGNILVRVGQGKPYSERLFRSKPHVVFLDVGMTAELSKNDRLNLIELFKAVALRDGRRAAECTLKFSRYQRCPDPNAFIKEVDSLFKSWRKPECEMMHQAECMQELLEQVRRHKVSIDGNVCIVMVTTLVLEGWQRKLDPNYNAMDTLQTLLFKVDWTKSLSYTIEGLMAP